MLLDLIDMQHILDSSSSQMYITLLRIYKNKQFFTGNKVNFG